MQFEGISAIVPVYNSRDTLRPLVARLKGTLESCCDDFEVILINDGSFDNRWQVVG